jgi:hypothetical protein
MSSYLVDQGAPGRWFVWTADGKRAMLDQPERGYDLAGLRVVVRRLRSNGSWRSFRGPTMRGPHWKPTPQQRDAARRRAELGMEGAWS